MKSKNYYKCDACGHEFKKRIDGKCPNCGSNKVSLWFHTDNAGYGRKKLYIES